MGAGWVRAAGGGEEVYWCGPLWLWEELAPWRPDQSSRGSQRKAQMNEPGSDERGKPGKLGYRNIGRGS